MHSNCISTLGICLVLLAGNASAGCEQLSVDTSLGIVRDNASGLTWSRCLLGQAGGNCFGDAAALAWVDALNRARAAEIGGIRNWRMPKIEELEKLHVIGSGCFTQAFPGTGSSIAWSASANIDYATDAWSFDFGNGEARVQARDSPLQVLLVASPL